MDAFLYADGINLIILEVNSASATSPRITAAQSKCTVENPPFIISLWGMAPVQGSEIFAFLFR